MKRLAESFRDPSGFLFYNEGRLYRQINACYQSHYDLLMSSGLYRELVNEGLLVSHEEITLDKATPPDAYKIIKPELVPFISHPYEWCFSQLKDAALVTLAIQKKALRHNMILKDASAYNVQFKGVQPIFIDSLSFEKYVEGEPWVAYRQFCQHFLAPLTLMSQKDYRLIGLLKNYIDGIPLDLASCLLPWGSHLNFSTLMHIHLHAKSQIAFSNKPVTTSMKISRLQLIAMIDSLERAIVKTRWNPGQTEWGDYYKETNYSSAAFCNKQEVIRRWLADARPGVVWDVGANTGVFSRLARDSGALTVAFDSDMLAVEKNYLDCRRQKVERMIPLVMDLTAPSPAVGWAEEERPSLLDRAPADLLMALALIHHLAISNNVPLSNIASFFSRCAKFAIVEFVPKSDSQVQRLLASRRDVFYDYTQEAFERAFEVYFEVMDCVPICDSDRKLYLMKGRSG